jgi:hypothetical protein
VACRSATERAAADHDHTDDYTNVVTGPGWVP